MQSAHSSVELLSRFYKSTGSRQGDPIFLEVGKEVLKRITEDEETQMALINAKTDLAAVIVNVVKEKTQNNFSFTHTMGIIKRSGEAGFLMDKLDDFCQAHSVVIKEFGGLYPRGRAIDTFVRDLAKAIVCERVFTLFAEFGISNDFDPIA